MRLFIPLKLFLVAALAATVLVLSACDDASDCDGFNSNNCFGAPPQFARLTLELTINDENRNVPVEIFEGDYDDPGRYVFIRDTVPFNEVGPGNEVFYDLPIQRWNVAVTYAHEGKRIVAIDSRRLDYRTETDCAGFECYTPVDRQLNMRLKIRD